MVPNIIIYLTIMLFFIAIWIIFMKRPIYEALFISFLLLVLITNNYKNIFIYINSAMNTSLIYSMVVFVAMSQLLSHTKIVDSCIYLILSLLGRITGGAGYASIIASCFMGSLSGSGPANVMATGVVTIPAMKKSGFPPELAANIESVSSYMGNMIPPSSNILGAFGVFMSLYPNSNVSSGKFWIILWGIAIYFVIQRIFMVWFFCKYYKIKPMEKEDIPGIKENLKNGWKGLIVPLIIFIPFIFDLLCNDLIVKRLGKIGASIFSKCLLLIVGGITSWYIVIITNNKKNISFWRMIELFSSKMNSLVGPISACIFGYMIGEVFGDLDITLQLETFINRMNLSRFELSIFIPILTAFIGMVIPGSSQIVIFGPLFISVFAAVGCDPLFIAAMLPCICGTMCGITPPLALGMYAGMSIAESDFKKTLINDLWWVGAQYVLEVIILMGWLPIIGI